MKYYLIVGEASGDLHASHLMQALKKYDAEADFRFFGGTINATDIDPGLWRAIQSACCQKSQRMQCILRDPPLYQEAGGDPGYASQGNHSDRWPQQCICGGFTDL